MFDEEAFIKEVHSFLERISVIDEAAVALNSPKIHVVGLLTKHSGAALHFTATGAQIEIWDSTTGGAPRKLRDIPRGPAIQSPSLTAIFLATVAYCHTFSGETVASWEKLAMTLCTAFAERAS